MNRKKSQFTSIGIMGKPEQPEFVTTLNSLVNILKQYALEIILESSCHPQLKNSSNTRHYPAAEIGQHVDMLIVIGGDGSLLRAARLVVQYQTPVVGVNRGRLGFLTDILPQTLQKQIEPILNGEYQLEKRFLLETQIMRSNDCIGKGTALNDIVLYSGDIARMITSEVYVNGKFVYQQRSDGLIAATPTGSTAYALSGGGPILSPDLEALVLVPMHPHTLSSRPIVLQNHSKIKLLLKAEDQLTPRVSCDGQIHFNVQSGDEIHIQKHEHTLNLLHPNEYDYFNVLRTKLHWASGNKPCY